MAAGRVYRFDYIDPSATVGVYHHGYGIQDAVAYSAVVYVENSNWPDVSIDMTQTRVNRHVDGTVARTVWVTNSSWNSPCTVDILIIVESF